MATFRVGQRVRVVSCFDPIMDVDASKAIGTETTIVRGAIVRTPTGREDGYLVAIRGRHGTPLCFVSYQLEPIIDDGRTVITWDACCWQPPQELVEAPVSNPTTTAA